MIGPLEATVIGTCVVIAVTSAVVAWAVWRADRDRVGRVNGTNHLAARLTHELATEAAARALLEARVAHLEALQRHQTGTGPRLGVPIGRPGPRQAPGRKRLSGLPGASEGELA